MLLFNIVLAVVVLGFIGAGAKDGFIHTLGRLVGAVVGYLAAKRWYLGLAMILGLGSPGPYAKVASFLIIFLLAARVIGYIFKLAEGAFSILSILPFLKSINKLLGGILGLAEGIIILGGVFYLVKFFNVSPEWVKLIANSVIASWLQHAFQILLAFLL